MLTETPKSRNVSTHALIMVVIAAVILAVTVIVTMNQLSDSESDTERPSAKAPESTYDQALEQPLDDGRQIPLAEARPLIPFEIPLPSHELANPDNLNATWISPTNHVALRFSSDVLIIMKIPDFENAAVEFAELIASGSVKNGRLDLVQDQPALVMEPNSDVDGLNPGSLQFVRDGVSITLYGRDLSGETLKDIATTLSA